MVVIWGFDRTVRLVRIAYCNLNVRAGKHFISTTSSTVKYCEDSDLVRIETYPATKTLTPRPGQFYYIYQPVSWKGWENHPFTLGAYVTDQEKTEGGIPDPKLIFYIRPCDGWARRLRDQCRKAGSEIHPTGPDESDSGRSSSALRRTMHVVDDVRHCGCDTSPTHDHQNSVEGMKRDCVAIGSLEKQLDRRRCTTRSFAMN